MIYEVWVNSVLDNVYSVVCVFSEDDGNRFIIYFKVYYDIDNEDALADEVYEVIEDVCWVLYGEMEDYV